MKFDSFDTMLEALCHRPAMYVGHESLFLVSCYLEGYCQALDDAESAMDPLGGFGNWVFARYAIFNPGWGWTRVLRHVFGNDRAALDAFPSLHSEFRQVQLDWQGDSFERVKAAVLSRRGTELWSPHDDPDDADGELDEWCYPEIGDL